MKLKLYLALAVSAFVVATLGSDLIARTSVAGENVTEVLRELLHWNWEQFSGSLLLAAPFIAVACICALAQRRARDRSAITIFAIATITLLYFYLSGYQAYQHALLERQWTAAAMAIGLLPFFIGIPVAIAAALAGALAARFDRRMAADRS
jgi:ABC-type proline/glycine betaine transport system permease subunit